VDELTTLLLAAQRGDRAAFARFATRIEFVLLCCLRMCPWARSVSAETDDILQETLLRCWKSLAEFDGRAALPWAWRICRNVAIDLLRRRSTRPGFNLDATPLRGVDLPAARPGPDVLAEAREAWARLRRVLAELPEDARQMIRLHYFQGLSHADCADRLGLSRDAFNMKMIWAISARHHIMTGVPSRRTRHEQSAPTRRLQLRPLFEPGAGEGRQPAAPNRGSRRLVQEEPRAA
jgi:RNA polymerase sigma-70 factor (ECF subfamily)